MGLDIYELVLEVEEEFDLKIPNADMQRIRRVGDLYDATVKNLREQHPEIFASSPCREIEIWEQLKLLLINELAVKPEQVVKLADFHYHLGFE